MRRDGNATVETRLLFSLSTAALKTLSTGAGTSSELGRKSPRRDTAMGETERAFLTLLSVNSNMYV